MITRQEYDAMARGFLSTAAGASDVPPPETAAPGAPKRRGRRQRPRPSSRAVLMDAALAAAELARTAPDEDGGQFT